MTAEAFVYCWTNKNNNNVYVGSHKGTPDDGYICTSYSARFWADWETDDWTREILAEGSHKDMVQFEKRILQSMDLTDMCYNNSAGGGIVFTDEVRAKMSAKAKASWTPERRAANREAALKRGATPAMIAASKRNAKKPRSAKWKAAMSKRMTENNPMKGKTPWNKGISKYNQEDKQ